jgi:hypothetical protein
MEPEYPPPTKVPCNDCPWRRVATAGWLGPYSPERWVQAAHGESAIACHKTITNEEWDDPGMLQCAGAATYRANVHKLPLNPTIARLEQDHERIFSTPQEFLKHHRREED